MNIHYTRQRGTTLAVALIFLLILTILGVTSVSNSILQQKMAGNMRDQAVAFEAAEAAVRAGETWIKSQTQKPNALPDNSPPGGITPAGGLTTVWQTGVLGNLADNSVDYDWWMVDWIGGGAGNGAGADYEATTDQTIAQAKTQPRYVIEQGAFIPDELNVGNLPPPGRQYYRVTGYGVGATRTAQATTQSTFVKRFR